MAEGLGTWTLYQGDCLESIRAMPAESVHCCITSPPYFGLRDYGVDGQIGLEATPDEFVHALVEVFREVRRVLRDDGTLWLNLGDSYSRPPAKGGSGPGGKNIAYSDSYTSASSRRSAGSNVGQRAGQLKRKFDTGLADKQLLGIPWRVAFALQADGWYLRQDIIWHKPNVMPESVRDRCTKAHEYIFLLSKSPRYYFDHEAIKEPTVCNRKPGQKVKETQHYGAGNGGNSGLTGLLQRYHNGDAPTTRNKRSVWTVPPKPYRGAHFATFPPELIQPCILAGCPVGGTVLDPFGGSGTTAGAALSHGRNAVLCELNPEYSTLMPERIMSIIRKIDAPSINEPSGESPMAIYVTPFDDQQQTTGPSTDSGFQSIAEVVDAMGPDWLTCSGRAVVYPGLMFSDYVLRVES